VLAHGTGAGLPHGETDLVEQVVVDAGAPRHRRRDEPSRADVRRQRTEAQVDGGHVGRPGSEVGGER
jgi:hypothetical protein